MHVIKRFFSDNALNHISLEFKEVIELINEYGGELDFQIRPNDSFNIYYKGNSLASVKISNEYYHVKIHQKFLTNKSSISILTDKRFAGIKPLNNYYNFKLKSRDIYPFFQKKYIDDICKNITRVAYQEELILEQSIITDNIDNANWIILDRQIRDNGFKQRMDLLAAKKVENGIDYNFAILEIKLGNNSTIRNSDAQLKSYISQVDKNFVDYKETYEKNYEQKVQLKLISSATKKISIVKPVIGYVIIGRYKGIASKFVSNVKSPLIQLYSSLP